MNKQADRLRHLLSWISIYILLSTPGYSQTRWKGSTNTHWTTLSNWTGGASPVEGAALIIDNSTTSPHLLLLDKNHGVGVVTFGNTGTRESAFTLQTGAFATLGIASGVTANANFDAEGTLPFGMRGKYEVSANQSWSVGGEEGEANSDRGAVVRAQEEELLTGDLILNGKLTKIGTGQLSFLGISVSGPGDIEVNNGALKLNAGGGLPLDLRGPGNLTVNSTGKLFSVRSSGTFGTFDRQIALQNGAIWVHESHSAGASVIGSPLNWGGDNTFTVDANLTLSGPWTGSGMVNKNGPDFLVLSGDSSDFGGTLRNNAGNLLIDNRFGGNLELSQGRTTLNGHVDGYVSVFSPARLLINGPDNATLIDGELAVSSGGSISGEAVVGNLFMNGARLGVNPQTVAALRSQGTPDVASVVVCLDTMPSSSAYFPILKWNANDAWGNGDPEDVFDLAGGEERYRNPDFRLNGKQVELSVETANLVWQGSSGTWDFTNIASWSGGSPAGFHQLDSVVFEGSTSLTVTLGSGLELRPASVIFNRSGTTQISGSGWISGGATITKNGIGELIFGGGGNQDFTGPVIVNAGRLKLNEHAALGRASRIEIASGACVDLNGKTPAAASVGRGDHTYHIAGTGIGGTGALINTSSTPSQGRAGVKSVVLTGNALISSNGRYDIGFDALAGFGTITGNGHTLTIRTDSPPLNSADSGNDGMAIRGNAGASVIHYVVEQGAIWAEDDDSAFGGATGSLRIKNSARGGTYGQRTIATPVYIEAGGTLHNQGVNLVGGTGTWTGGITLEGNATIHTGTHRIVVDSNITETSSGRTLTKDSTGELVLGENSNCTYTGMTTVNAGALLVDGSHGGNGGAPITLVSAAILGGKGRIHGTVTVAGTLAPGEVKGKSSGTNPIGTLRTGPATLTGSFSYDINGPVADRLNVDGNLDIDDCVLAISPLALAPSANYIIATYTGTLNGPFESVSGIPAGYSVVYSAGKIELINPSLNPSAFQTWAAAVGLGGNDSGPLEDKDKDGKNNITEFAFNDSPLAGNPENNWGCRSSNVGGQEVLTLTIQARAGAVFAKNPLLCAQVDEVIYHVQGSTGLGDWTRDVTEVTNAAELSVIRSGMPAPPSGWSYYTFRSPGTVGTVSKDFLRAWAEPAP